jgi:hypothetical protein
MVAGVICSYLSSTWLLNTEICPAARSETICDGISYTRANPKKQGTSSVTQLIKNSLPVTKPEVSLPYSRPHILFL